ncbi:winged helix DNA-binding protein [Ralstonia soli]|uniref:Winged helix DNA-binding protein n=1 Tax=Ralstonia soli TaxID=2953896 RepID=A0ABT1AM39_9RALS|nr:winged helix DNA-binding protein [Ralstonia soli]MCO5399473.1 winged helix DNA-binding protein [Ralstonia soli]
MPLNNVFDFISAVDRLRRSVDQWMHRCAQMAGIGHLSPLERKALVRVGLHEVPVRFSRLCFELCVTDPHLATYALKKLEKLALLSKHRVGKETEYALTAHGVHVLEQYRALLGDACNGNRPLPSDQLSQGHRQLLEWGQDFDDAARHMVLSELKHDLRRSADEIAAAGHQIE